MIHCENNSAHRDLTFARLVVIAGKRAMSLLVRLGRDRRGGAAMTFAIASLAFLGLVGLATEAGRWYLANRQGQNGADAAAVAGARAYLAMKDSSNTFTYSAAQDAAVKNNFTTGTNGITVIPSRPPTMGSHTGDNSAVEVIINQTQAISFSRLFGLSAARVSNRAVATTVTNGNACVLALTGDLTLNGNFTVNASNCMLAGNNTDSTSINIGGSSIVNVQSLRAVGGCSGCNGGNVTLQSPAVPYSSPTTDPFAALGAQSWSPSSYQGNSCDNSKYGTGQTNGISSATLTPTYVNTGVTPAGSGKAFCSDLQMGNGDSFIMTPGTYIWYNSNFNVTGGSLTCPTCNESQGLGVHIVLLGDNGNKMGININGSATVTLNAGATDSTNPNLDGVLFFRQNVAATGNSTSVSINGGSSTNLAGGFYFPGASASYNGNGNSNCTVIVGGTITMNGTATLDQSGCSNIGTNTGKMQLVTLVE